jgi:hypothetical protein
MTTPTRITGEVNLGIPRLTHAVGLTLARMEGPVDLAIPRIVGETGAGGGVAPIASALLLEDGFYLLLEDGSKLLLE